MAVRPEGASRRGPFWHRWVRCAPTGPPPGLGAGGWGALLLSCGRLHEAWFALWPLPSTFLALLARLSELGCPFNDQFLASRAAPCSDSHDPPWRVRPEP